MLQRFTASVLNREDVTASAAELNRVLLEHTHNVRIDACIADPTQFRMWCQCLTIDVET